MATTPEGKVKAQVKKAIENAFPKSYRFMPVQIGMGDPGLDFFYCIPPLGLWVAIETKVPGKKPTPRQLYTIQQIEEAGGSAYVVHNEQEIHDMIEEIKWRIEDVTRC